MTGYMHPDYVESMAEFGLPRALRRSGGWILEREIPGFPYRDAMGCYPLFCCQDWRGLEADLDEIGNELVSLSVVADPFGLYNIAYLERCFHDVVVRFKEAFIVDLHRPYNEIVSRNRRKKVKKTLREISVELCEEPQHMVDEWVSLYANLIERHCISGIRAFSKTAFTVQMSIPGTVLLRAIHLGVTVGSTLWYVQGDIAYGHLAAFSNVGYELQASYALDGFAIEYFKDKIRWLYFGPGPGISGDATDGLSLYKRRWSTDTRPVYFCGRIFNPENYEKIIKQKKIVNSSHFPAYRQGEFS